MGSGIGVIVPEPVCADEPGFSERPVAVALTHVQREHARWTVSHESQARPPPRPDGLGAKTLGLDREYGVLRFGDLAFGARRVAGLGGRSASCLRLWGSAARWCAVLWIRCPA